MKHARALLFVCLLGLLLIPLIATPVWGQAGTSTIRGTVMDPQKAVVPGATVTITNLKTNLTRVQTTGEAGNFNFELIPVGEYRVEVQIIGFRKKAISPVQALVGSVAEVTVDLEVGEVTSVVTVEATSTVIQVNAQDATLGNNIVNKQITQLPMEARNVQALLTLQPGVTGTPDAAGYVAGARSDQSNITLDGVDINEAQTSSLDAPVLRLNSEAIEEFRVTTVNANANMGRSSAAQINLVTKSGGNEFSGSLFEYHRNTIFTANDFFSNRAGVDRQKLIRNTFGGTFGGPIQKDKLFFFYSYEGRRDASDQALTRTVPLAHLGQGQMQIRGQFCTDPINLTGCGAVQTVTMTLADLQAAFPTVGINPTAVSALQAAASAYPVNDPLSGDGLNTGGYRFNAATPVKLNSHVAKFDWNISNTMNAFVRFNFIRDKQSLAPQFPGTPSPDRWDHPWGLSASHNWTIGNNWVNSFRYGYTRQAFTLGGDSADNNISFRFIFQPLLFQRELSRKTPVHNIVNDTSWMKGSHTFNFGTNVRITGNNRVSFANSYDTAITNPSFYPGGGTTVSDAISAYLLGGTLPVNVLTSVSEAQNSATALIGRYTQYTARFIFDADGSLTPPATASDRIFKTQEYDLYFQDSWKVKRNLTLTFGLRYGISRPVYETSGFGVVTDISGSEILRRRIEAGYNGTNYDDPLELILAGGDGKGPLYDWDKNNFQPRVAVAWSPEFEAGFLKAIFGSGGKSVIRAGYGMTNDYYGQALAVLFDLNNTLGFSSNYTSPANMFNLSTNPAPLFGGYTDDVRTLPGVVVPGSVSFPREQVSDMRRRIETGIDTNLVAPYNHVWNLTIERELPWGLVFQTSYTGRLGRDLLAQRDIMAITNLRDPASGVDWYTAATQLEVIRQTRPPGSTAVTPIPYFENVFPSTLTADLNSLYVAYDYCSASLVDCIPTTFTPTQAIFWVMRNWYGNDWTTLQDDLEVATGNSYFYNPQYGALTAWGTFAKSNYHGLSVSLRQRLRGVSWDFNYTFSHSHDNASGLQNDASWGTSFVLNALRPDDNYSNSDFDLRHQINFNYIYELPFGRNKRWGSGVSRGWDALIGGWQLTGILRWNTGLPISPPYDNARWATNWQVQSNATQVTSFEACPTRGDATTAPKLFGCDPTAAYRSFRNAYPGETGQRNIFRLPGYFNVDMGLGKDFQMPWNEKHKFQLRWEVFNIFNHQTFGTVDASRTGFGIAVDPGVRNLTPASNFSNFTAIQGDRRVMQIGAIFRF